MDAGIFMANIIIRFRNSKRLNVIYWMRCWIVGLPNNPNLIINIDLSFPQLTQHSLLSNYSIFVPGFGRDVLIVLIPHFKKYFDGNIQCKFCARWRERIWSMFYADSDALLYILLRFKLL